MFILPDPMLESLTRLILRVMFSYVFILLRVYLMMTFSSLILRVMFSYVFIFITCLFNDDLYFMITGTR